MTYEGSESAWDNFGKLIYQLQPKTKTLVIITYKKRYVSCQVLLSEYTQA